MRKWLMSTALAGGLMVGGCTTTQVTNFLAQVQADAASVCLFVPTIDTVLAVATALGIPWGSIVGGAVSTVANAICSQVPPPASAAYRSLNARGGPAKTIGIYNNVPINGWHV